jgi:endonuclease/exonuclease/phosphatase (EEP) superfamily protein YafD
MVLTLLRYLVLAFGLCIIGGTLLSLSRHPHWLVRGWDFPRVHIATLGAVSGGAYAAFFCTWQWPEWLFLLALVGCVAWQGYRIFPYTPLAAVQVQRSRAPTPDGSLRLLIANVLMQNRQYDRFFQLVRTVDPDMILAVEIDDRWLVQLQPLEQLYPYAVRQPQDNMYGMLLLSRLQLINPHVRFMVQKDIPSIHTEVALRNGVRVVFYGLHPRPPEPLRDQDAIPRNAELLLVGDEISTHNRPSIVAGDLNDVAWSKTTEFFLRLSGLLDPRVGRGFYNTFNAHNPVFRFPLDHIFHSSCFTLRGLRRLGHIGSDHFPMCIELYYEPEVRVEQPPLEQTPELEEEAQEQINEAIMDTSVREGEALS